MSCQVLSPSLLAENKIFETFAAMQKVLNHSEVFIAIEVGENVETF